MNITDIKSDIDFLCGTTSATYPDADKIRNINLSYHNVSRLIWDAQDAWQFDDINNTDLPYYRKTMVNETKKISIPPTLQKIERMEVLDNDSNWQKLKPLEESDITLAMPEYREDSGLPVFYELKGNYVSLYPSPASASVTLASGLAFYGARDVNEFATTASTATPGFATQFHRILSISTALDFEKDEQQRNFLLLLKDKLEKGLTRFYSNRQIEIRSSLKPRGKKRWAQYM